MVSFAIVGKEVFDQQTPRKVIVPPPLLVILPPEITDVDVMLDAVEVDREGISGCDISVISFP